MSEDLESWELAAVAEYSRGQKYKRQRNILQEENDELKESLKGYEQQRKGMIQDLATQSATIEALNKQLTLQNGFIHRKNDD